MGTLVAKWSAYPSAYLPASPTLSPCANWTGASCVRGSTYWGITWQYIPAATPTVTTRVYSPATSRVTGYDWGSNGGEEVRLPHFQSEARSLEPGTGTPFREASGNPTRYCRLQISDCRLDAASPRVSQFAVSSEARMRPRSYGDDSATLRADCRLAVATGRQP
jgi:hypothetical protein